MPLYSFTPRWNNRRVWLPGLAAALGFPLVVHSEYILNVAVLCGIYIILTSGLNITNGYTGLFSFGHAAFYGIGAYTAGILATRYAIPFWLTLPLGGIVAGLFGLAIALPTLRLRGIFLALITIGFQEIVFLVTLNWIALTRGPMGIPGIPPPAIWGHAFRSNRDYYYLILALVVLILFLISRIIDSRLGRAFAAIREDEVAAQSVGIATFPTKVLAFVIATVLAGVAGAFFAHHARFISADSFRLDETFVILTMLIVGGMGTLIGPVIGAIFLVILPEASRFLVEYREVVYGLILIGVILFRPEGIAGIPGIIHAREAPVRMTGPSATEPTEK
ncbi:MAG TPA: branched-chain amino acid ABC transporter permease [archaeon]|nr:branched-chain amino acid ABC transporter permease [archaeon]